MESYLMFSLLKAALKCLWPVFLFIIKWQQKHWVPETYYINNDYAIQSLHQIRHNAKSSERQKTSFPKESVENAGLHKPVLKKVMTTHK